VRRSAHVARKKIQHNLRDRKRLDLLRHLAVVHTRFDRRRRGVVDEAKLEQLRRGVKLQTQSLLQFIDFEMNRSLLALIIIWRSLVLEWRASILLFVSEIGTRNACLAIR